MLHSQLFFVGVKLVGIGADAVPAMRGSIAVMNGIGVADHEQTANSSIGRNGLPAAQQFPFILSHAHTPIGKISTTAFPPFTTSKKLYVNSFFRIKDI